VGDTVVSSGWDGVFPKGLRIGYVSEVVKRTSGIFQEIKVTPFVDFDKLEEVLVILNPPDHDFMSGR
jgi:rod shape-determining protein MreC